jgi:hypothetical protein
MLFAGGVCLDSVTYKEIRSKARYRKAVMRSNWSPWKGKMDCSLFNLKFIYNEVIHKVIWEMSDSF